VGFISAIPATIRVHQKLVEMVEINFLCVHKKLRTKRMAPVLIKEITRRVNLLSVWQAVYTAGVNIPTPIGAARYWHRNLNPQKLIIRRTTPLFVNYLTYWVILGVGNVAHLHPLALQGRAISLAFKLFPLILLALLFR